MLFETIKQHPVQAGLLAAAFCAASFLCGGIAFAWYLGRVVQQRIGRRLW